jgi:hypothetical protein
VTRTSVRDMESGPVAAVIDALHAARAAVSAIDVGTLSHAELLQLLDHLETDTRRAPVLAHRVINRLAAEANPLELGATSLSKLLAFHLRVAQVDARRRIDCAAELGQRLTLSGESMAHHPGLLRPPPRLSRLPDAGGSRSRSGPHRRRARPRRATQSRTAALSTATP